MNDQAVSLLSQVRLVGGDRAVFHQLRELLGNKALHVKNELRLVGLGCAGFDTADRLERAFER